ncbi:class I SAM-dependent methyltransferase [Pelagibius sp. 7325]|uniref:class I SAM-dependent methyltransferase n=1 Tax=Pelagibius sp. 7325 TaxID=3131994 RepID=UPI0030EF0CE7
MIRLDTCPACESAETRTVAGPSAEVWRRLLAFSERRYNGFLNVLAESMDLRVLTCDRCTHCWYAEIPDSEMLSGMYAAAVPFGNATQAAVESYGRATPSMVDRMARIRAIAARLAVPAEAGGGLALLDYGSGTGRWATAAVRAGFTATALEPHAHRVEQQDEDFEVVTDEGALLGRQFDVLHLEQVLEHVPEPQLLLRRLRPLCRATTLLVVRVPNLAKEAMRSNVWGDWPYDGVRPHIMAPFEHLHGFTPRSLQALIRAAGFRPLRATTVSPYFPRHVLHRFAGRLHPALGQTEVFGILGA